MQWLDASKELPPNTDDVLVWRESGLPFIGFYTGRVWRILKDDYIEVSNVKYWAIITPPTEGE